ncbi:uncharacterized protein LOC141719027 [Apium graveolens]|uniref:uncharacterized protein LOC141719027 n=1 Tax=Apium graveolens TaxID=4045 RepID=UPI003D79952C
MAENQLQNNNLQNTTINYNDPYFLSSGDNPRQQLGNMLLSGDNFINWSRGVKMALGAKNKLVFIDGTLPVPESTSPDYNKWIRNDYMVLYWLIFSMEPVIANSFIFASSARELWIDVSDRFGKSNAPLLYELHTSLSRIEQQNLSIAEYYGKLKIVWDKLQVLEGHFDCNCGALAKCSCNLIKKFSEAAETKKLIQFICGLNKSFDLVKTNLLSMEPLPTVLKAYHILQQIEKQQNISVPLIKSFDVSAFYSHKNFNSASRIMSQKKDFKKNKMDLVCDHCKRKGHSVEQCFKLVGFPDWYNNLKGKQNPGFGNSGFGSGFGNKFVAQVSDSSGQLSSSPLDIGSGSQHLPAMDSQMVTAVYKKVLKMM